MNLEAFDTLVGGLGLISNFLLFLLVAIWFIVPFVFFGTKSKLDRQIVVLEMLTQSVRDQSAILRRMEELARIDARQIDAREVHDQELGSVRAGNHTGQARDPRAEPRIIPYKR